MFCFFNSEIEFAGSIQYLKFNFTLFYLPATSLKVKLTASFSNESQPCSLFAIQK